ncbi:MAG: penicillin-binding transpeptidase domain-containing protein [Dysosmobacter welbionis]
MPTTSATGADRDAGADSCNQSFIRSVHGWARGFLRLLRGLRSPRPTGIGLPAEPKELYYTAEQMGPVELASCAFGQSSKVSYLEMAAAVCAMVGGGRLMRPYVVSTSSARRARSSTISPRLPARCSRKRPPAPCGR